MYLTLVVAAYATAMAFLGLRQRRPEFVASAENGAHVVFGLLTLASVALAWAFVTHDFSLEYVAHYSSRDLPAFYALSAFWGGQSGSLLLWAWLLALFSSVVVLQNRRKNRPLMPAVVVGVLAGIELFFVG